MHRFDAMTDSLRTRLHTLTGLLPQLGSDFDFERTLPASGSSHVPRHARNRWSRTDLISAIDRNLHDVDVETVVWPPALHRR